MQSELTAAYEQIYLNHTIAALEDKLVYILSSKTECDVYFDSDWDNKWLIHPFHPYVNQAESLLYQINIKKPLPEFVIFPGDIPAGLTKELNSLGKVKMNEVITNAVRRLYESVDFDYYHTNGIYGKVKWETARTKK
jgi:hypothetical protein